LGGLGGVGGIGIAPPAHINSNIHNEKIQSMSIQEYKSNLHEHSGVLTLENDSAD